MNKSLTIVLPVHNVETGLRQNVERMLEVAAELTENFSVLIVDDGSHDDTFEVASHLAAHYPQVSVVRQSTQRGLGHAMRRVRRQVQADVVIVHDGVSTIDANELRRLWDDFHRPAESGISELRHVARTHQAMEQAHSRLTGFHLLPSVAMAGGALASLQMTEHMQQEPMPAPLASGKLRDGKRRDRVGQIPPLPRPNFREAITDFALGE